MPVVDYIKAVYADKNEVRGRLYISEAESEIIPNVSVHQIMTPPLSVTPETTLETLILKFAGTRFFHFP
jgi:CBS domain-containing protein